MGTDRRIDERYRRIVSLAAELRRCTDPARRRRLEAELETLRAEAAADVDRGRHPESLRRELATARRRLEEIEELFIGDSWPQRHERLWINDPSTYAVDINRRLWEQHEEERNRLLRRIEEIERHLASRPPPTPDDSRE